MLENVKFILEEVDQKIGVKPFYSTRDLVDAGVFGSLVSARRALLAGRLIYIKISPRRFVVARSVLCSFLEKNFAIIEACK